MFKANVGTASSELRVHARDGEGFPLEGDMPDGHVAAGCRTRLVQCLLDAEPRETVAEVAHGLVVFEVGLQDPAFGLLAAHNVAVLVVGICFNDKVAFSCHGLGAHDNGLRSFPGAPSTFPL